MLVASGDVAGVSVQCLLDTGSGTTMVGLKHVVDQLSEFDHVPTMVFSPQTGDMRVLQKFQKVPVSIDGFPSYRESVVDSPIHLVSQLSNWEIEALVGQDYIRHLRIEFHGENGEPKLLKPGIAILREHVSGLVKDGDVYRLSVRLPGKLSEDVIIDTGASGTLSLTPQVIAKLKAMGHVQAVNRVTSQTAFGTHRFPRYLLRWVIVGQTRFVDLPVKESRVSLIGLELLRRLHCTLDFPNKLATFSPSKIPSEIRICPGAIGVGLYFERNGRLIVDEVEEDFPGNSAGIVSGDEILEIDRQPVGDRSIHDIRDRLSQAGQMVELKLRSQDTVSTVSLKLDRPYEYPPKWEPEDPHAAPRPFPNLDEPAKSN
ncbi:MAG: PDZ domain-containing protein [Planctomycetaceae bacterium]|nr:PDZ domain-containing protein [Planctomycetaceae bacterium]